MARRHTRPSSDTEFLWVLLLADLLGKLADLINGIQGK
jgi:hypothetical protein